MDGQRLATRLRRLSADELGQELKPYLQGEGSDIENALATELVRRACLEENALDAYAAHLTQRGGAA